MESQPDTDLDKPLLVVARLRIPILPGFPGVNLIGAKLLRNLIADALFENDIPAGEVSYAGPLNDSLFVVKGTKPAAAVQLRKTFTELSLLPFASIWWWDSREIFMRPLCTGISRPANFDASAMLELCQAGLAEEMVMESALAGFKEHFSEQS